MVTPEIATQRSDGEGLNHKAAIWMGHSHRDTGQVARPVCAVYMETKVPVVTCPNTSTAQTVSHRAQCPGPTPEKAVRLTGTCLIANCICYKVLGVQPRSHNPQSICAYTACVTATQAQLQTCHRDSQTGEPYRCHNNLSSDIYHGVGKGQLYSATCTGS